MGVVQMEGTDQKVAKEKKSDPLFTILAVDDEEGMREAYKSILGRAYRLLTASSGTEGLEVLKRESVDLVILDLRMPGMDGITALAEIKKLDIDVDVVVVSASHDLKGAIDCMKRGAYDFVPKPFEVEELLSTIRNSLERRALRRENIYLKSAVEEKFEEMVAASTPMLEIFQMIETIAENCTTVLILGESGTGKELVARAIHKKSPRRDQPFVAVNCAAIPDNLFESELFGHEKGSFTGAFERRIGKFEMADRGTIFLDEVGCLPQALQGKLLRVIQESEIERVGGTRPFRINVRIIAATNSNLQKLMREGKFRDDLFYRLNVIPLHLPPLRERGEDIHRLAYHFLTKLNHETKRRIQGFAPEVLEAFRVYHWPGNVRELGNIVERLVTLEKGEQIGLTYLPPELKRPPMPFVDPPSDIQLNSATLKESLEHFEKHVVEQTLIQCHGNQTKAAQLLGVHRTTLISKLQSFGLDGLKLS